MFPAFPAPGFASAKSEGVLAELGLWCSQRETKSSALSQGHSYLGLKPPAFPFSQKCHSLGKAPSSSACVDQIQSSQDSPSSSRSQGFGMISSARGILLLLPLNTGLNSLQTLSSLQGFLQNLESNHMEIPFSSGVSESSPEAAVFSLPLLRPHSVWGLSVTAGTPHSTAKGTWAHKKAAKTKLAKGHLRSLPASLGSSTQI